MGFHGKDDQVHRANLRRVVGGGNRHSEVTFRLDQLEPFFFYRRQVSTPSNQGDVISGLGQQPAITPSDAASAHYRNFQKPPKPVTSNTTV